MELIFAVLIGLVGGYFLRPVVDAKVAEIKAKVGP